LLSVVGVGGAPSARVSGAPQGPVAAIVRQLPAPSGNFTSQPTKDVALSIPGTALHANFSLDVYVDPSASLGFSAQTRLQDALKGLAQLLAPDGIAVSQVATPASATVILRAVATTPIGGQAAGVLGVYDPLPTGAVIDLVTGWNWYTQASPSGISSGQFDLETIVVHELGHALGLGHSDASASVMYPTLNTGQVKRTMSPADLLTPLDGHGPDALMASFFALVPAGSLATVGTPPPAVATLPQSDLGSSVMAMGAGWGTSSHLALAAPAASDAPLQASGPLVSSALTAHSTPPSPHGGSTTIHVGPLITPLPVPNQIPPGLFVSNLPPLGQNGLEASNPELNTRFSNAWAAGPRAPHPPGQSGEFTKRDFPALPVPKSVQDPDEEAPAFAGFAIVVGMPAAARAIRQWRCRQPFAGSRRHAEFQKRRAARG
jgi:hypothetical protein